MNTYQIKHRNGSLITEGKAKSLGDFVVKSIRADISLCDADFRDVDLRGADFGGAWLHSTDFRNADLTGADFRDVDLRNANLRGADLCGVDFRGADLSYSWLHGADLSGAILTDIKHNEFTSGFDFDLYFDLRSRGIRSDAAISMVTL